MNCKNCRQLLLLQADFEPVPSEVEAHLGQCPACRRWQQRLAQVEKVVPLLPVPLSETKSSFKERVLRGLELEPVAAPAVRRWFPRRWPAALWVGAAAACVLLTVGVFLATYFSGSAPGPAVAIKNPPPEAKEKTKETTLAGRLLEKNLELARASTPKKRLEALADLASLLERESQSLSEVAGPQEMTDLAGLFGRVVNDGIVPRANSLPAPERRPTLGPIRDQLDKAGRHAEKMARAASPEKRNTWLQLAAVARDGHRRLSMLVEEDTP